MLLNLEGTVFKSKRIAGDAKENAYYTLKEGEHFEVGGDFGFEMSGNSSSKIGFPSLLSWETWTDETFGDSRIDGGKGGTPIENGMTISFLFQPNDAREMYIKFYADANDNGQWDDDEIYKDSATFEVVQPKIWEFDLLLPSTRSDPATIATFTAALKFAEEIILRKDADDDWRAAVKVRFKANSTPMVYTSGVNYLGVDGDNYQLEVAPTLTDHLDDFEAATPEGTIVYVQNLNAWNALGLTRRSNSTIFVEFMSEWSLGTVIAHEIGHVGGMGNEDHASDRKYIFAESGGPLGSHNMLRESDVEYYDEH